MYASSTGGDDSTKFSRRTLDYNEDYVFLYALLKMVGPFASLGEVDALIKKGARADKDKRHAK